MARFSIKPEAQAFAVSSSLVAPKVVVSAWSRAGASRNESSLQHAVVSVGVLGGHN